MSEPEKKQDKAVVEFTPFGADSKVKLSIAIIRSLICVPTKLGKLCSDEEALKFMAMCQARKLNPFEGDAFLIGYDTREQGPKFSLITAHQAFLKRAEVNEEFDGMESGVVVQEADGVINDIQGDFTSKGQQVVGGWARVYFKHRKYPIYRRIRLERFKKTFGVWVDDPAGMICKCAEADALRSSFPTMLGGLYLKEEGRTQGVEIVEATVESPKENGDRMRAALENREQSSSGRGASPAATGGASEPLPAHTRAETENKTKQEPPPPAQQASKPARKKASLKPKEDPPKKEERHPFNDPIGGVGENRAELQKRLAIGNCTESDFLTVCNKNEWLGKGRKWDSLDDVPDDMLSVFLQDEEWTVVTEQLEKLPRHTLD